MIEIKKIPSNVGYAANSYLITSQGECAVIDPSVPFDGEMLDGAELKYILLTHAHFDHFLEIDSWVKNSSATVVVSQKDRDSLADSHKNCYALFLYKDFGYNGDAMIVNDGDTISFGDIVMEIGEFPGHTPGSIIFKVEKCAFVGDVAFAGGGYGRFDLPGGDVNSLVESLKKILNFDEEMILYPGHGPETTVKDYKKHIQI